MALKKRTETPLKNPLLKYDEDLMIVLEDKILTSLR
jgi:hypothetical protein